MEVNLAEIFSFPDSAAIRVALKPSSELQLHKEVFGESIPFQTQKTDAEANRLGLSSSSIKCAYGARYRKANLQSLSSKSEDRPHVKGDRRRIDGARVRMHCGDASPGVDCPPLDFLSEKINKTPIWLRHCGQIFLLFYYL